MELPPTDNLAGPCHTSSPITSVPNELLAAIFKTAVSSASDYPLLHKTICGVSRHWRAVAVGSPDLWTDIRVGIRPEWILKSWYQPYRADLLSLNAAVEWFDRSKTCLLTFHLDVSHHTDVDALNRLTLVLLRHAHRLETLSIHASFPGVLKKLMTILCEDEGNTIHLRRLDLRIDNRMYTTQSSFDTIYWNGGQLLTSVSISHFPFQPMAPLHQLASISLGAVRRTLSQFRAMLASCPSLTTLALNKVHVDVSEVENDDFIEVPSLSTLAVCFSNYHWCDEMSMCSCLVRFISCPNLATLEISSSIISNPQLHFRLDRDALMYPALTTLRLAHLQSVTAANLIFFDALPTIKHFQLIRCSSVTFPYFSKERLSSWLDLESITFESASCDKGILGGLLKDDSPSSVDSLKDGMEWDLDTAIKLVQGDRNDGYHTIISAIDVDTIFLAGDEEDYDDYWEYRETGADFEGIYDSD